MHKVIVLSGCLLISITALADDHLFRIDARISIPSLGDVYIRDDGANPHFGKDLEEWLPLGTWVTVGIETSSQFVYWDGLPEKSVYAWACDPYSRTNIWLVNWYTNDRGLTAYVVGEGNPRRRPMRCADYPIINSKPTFPATLVTAAASRWGTSYLRDGQISKSQSGEDSDPVQAYSGEFIEDVVDLRIPSPGFDIVWGRRYRSQDYFLTAIGNNWDFSYNVWIDDQSSYPDIELHTGNGETAVFKYREEEDAYFCDPWPCKLEEVSGQTYEIVFGDGFRWRFNSYISQDPPPGTLASITDRNGNELNLTYTNGRLSVITDTIGRTLTISYYTSGDATGMIQAVTDSTGRQIKYDYYGANDDNGEFRDLRKVTYPAITGTPTGNDFSDGRTVEYTYSVNQESELLNHNLRTIRNARGEIYLENTYSTETNTTMLQFDHVIQQKWGDGLVSFHYSAIDPAPIYSNAIRKTIVKDREGNVVEYYFNLLNHLVQKHELTGRANPNLPTSNTENRPSGKVRSTDPNEYITRYWWNMDDYLVRREDPNGTITRFHYEQEVRTINFDYSWIDPRTRNNLREITRLPGLHTPTGSQEYISEKFSYSAPFSGCGCGDSFVSSYTDPKGNSTHFDYDDSGNLLAVQNGALEDLENFEYNESGQLTAHVHPDNGSDYRRRDEYSYAGPGAHAGSINTITLDTASESADYAFAYDAFGNVSAITDPKGHDTQFAYNSNGELVRTTSRAVGNGNQTRFQRDSIYDADGNIIRTLEDNVDADGNIFSRIISAFEYDSLNNLTRALRSANSMYDTEAQFEYDRNSNLTRIVTGVAASGAQPANTIELSYDERDLLYRATRGGTRTTQLDYDGNGNLVKRSIGIETIPRIYSSVFDGYDRLVKLTAPLQTDIEFTYDANGQVLSRTITGDNGGGTGSRSRLAEDVFEYDVFNRLISLNKKHFQLPGQSNIGDGESLTAFTYANNNALLTATDDANHTTSFAYDSFGRIASIVDAIGNSAEYAYDLNSNLTGLIAHANNDIGNDKSFAMQFSYDDLDRLIERTDGSSNATQYAYDSRDNLARTTDANGNVTNLTYDGLNRPTEESRAAAGGEVVMSRTWDANSRLTSLTDPAGNTTWFGYSPTDALIQIAYADGTYRQVERNLFDDAMETVEPNGTVFTDTHDTLGRLTSRDITPGPGVAATGDETFRYNALGLLTYAADADSTATFAYDSLGGLLQETLQLGNQPARTVSYTRNGLDNPSSMTYPGGRQIDFQYNAANLVASIADHGQPALAVYDYLGGSATRRSYRNGTQLDYAYDGIEGVANPQDDFGFGQIVQTNHTKISDGSAIDARNYAWDGIFNKTKRSDVRNGGPQTTYQYSYDALSRLSGSTKTISGGREFANTYTLDATGNRDAIAAPYDADWDYELGTGALMNRYTKTPFDTREYDAGGNLTALNPQTSVARNFTYDAYSQLTAHTMSSPGGGAFLTLDGFDSGAVGNWSELLGTWTGNGTLEGSSAPGRILMPVPIAYDRFTFSYHTAHDPASASTYDPEYYALAVLRSDPAANAWDYVALVIEPNGAFLREWRDDEVTQLASNTSLVTAADTWYEVEVRLDGANVQVWRGVSGQSKTLVLETTATTVLASDLIAFGTGANTDYRFDNVGISPAGTLDNDVSYLYDALGRRIAKTSNGATTYFYYAGAQLVEERDGNGEVLATYVYGNYVDEVLQMRRGGNDYFYHADDQFNVTAVTDAAGNVVERYDYSDYGYPEFYAPDGTPRAMSAIGNPFLFTGRQWDAELGAYYYRTRYLDPLAGRFLSPDTIGPWGDPLNFGNAYTYCGNNPWSYVDPYGRDAWGIGQTAVNGLVTMVTEPIYALHDVGSGLGGSVYGLWNPAGAVYAEDMDYWSQSARASNQRIFEGYSTSGNFAIGVADFGLGLTYAIPGVGYSIEAGPGIYHYFWVGDTTVDELDSTLSQAAGHQVAATASLGLIRAACKYTRSVKGSGEAPPPPKVTWNNGWRTPDGKFASPLGLGRPGRAAENTVLDAIETKPGWVVVRGPVAVRNAAGELRLYDGAAKRVNGNLFVGIEIKSSARGVLRQEKFDAGAHGNSPFSAVGKYEGQISIGRVIQVKGPK